VAETHPHALHALAALWSLRRAVDGYLPVLVEAAAGGVSVSGGQARARSRHALRQFDQLLRVERAERIVADRAGIRQVGASPAPVPAHLLDVRKAAEDAVTDAVWRLSSALRARPLLVWGEGWFRAAATPWAARMGWLTMVLPLAPAAAAADAAECLADADRRVRAACNVDPDEIPLPGAPPCPACGMRRLRIQTAAPDSAAWTITCRPQCVCRGPGETAAGDGCTCGMPVRAAGVRHIWDAGSQLAAAATATTTTAGTVPAAA
jgi:hypothetical protein